MIRRLRFGSLLVFALTAVFLTVGAAAAFASTGTIDATNHYAWDDNGGYVNWNATAGNVTVTDATLSGYIWSAGFGWINLSPTLGGVTNSNGALGGYAWGTNTGWINFAGVTIDSNGVFHGQTTAQSLFGTMTFDCTYCNVTTSWRNSTIMPTVTTTGGGGVISGSQSVGFQNAHSPTASAPSTTSRSLTPTKAPSTATQPKTGPGSSATPAHLTPSITLSIYTSPTATAGDPIALNISFGGKRSQPINYAYRLYQAGGSIVYSNAGRRSATDTSSFSVSIPTTGLTTGLYKVAVSAQYGKQSIVSQTVPIALYKSKNGTGPAIADTTNTPTPPTQLCSWLTCWWQTAMQLLARIF